MASLQLLLAVTVTVLAALYGADGRSVRSVSLRQTNSSLQQYNQINQKLISDNLDALSNWVSGTSLTNFTQASQAGLKYFQTTTSNINDAISKATNIFNNDILSIFPFLG